MAAEEEEVVVSNEKASGYFGQQVDDTALSHAPQQGRKRALEAEGWRGEAENQAMVPCIPRRSALSHVFSPHCFEASATASPLAHVEQTACVFACAGEHPAEHRRRVMSHIDLNIRIAQTSRRE